MSAQKARGDHYVAPLFAGNERNRGERLREKRTEYQELAPVAC